MGYSVAPAPAPLLVVVSVVVFGGGYYSLRAAKAPHATYVCMCVYLSFALLFVCVAVVVVFVSLRFVLRAATRLPLRLVCFGFKLRICMQMYFVYSHTHKYIR